MSVSLAMIVRDEGANLPACLASVRGLFDEAVIVDTGSTDDTIRIARSFGARVFRFAWIDDFSAARNFGLDRCRSDHVFRMDADDRLPTSQRKRLARLLASLRPDRPTAYACRVHAREPDGSEVTCDEFRLWPHLPALRFHGAIHERVRPHEDAPHVATAPAQVRIDHIGYEDREKLNAKLRRNLQILDAEALRWPIDPMTYFDLGRTLSALGGHVAALGALEDFLRTKDPSHTISGRIAHRRIVEIHRALGDPRAAMEAARRGLAEYPDDATLAAWVADLLRFEGLNDLAREGYERALALHRPGRMDAGISTDFVPRIRAALAECT